MPSLEAVAARHEVLAVFTQPDRPKGRGNQLAESPVKGTARELGIAIYKPERVRRPESMELLRGLATDLMVVVGYGQIIPQAIIDLPPHGILNVHASLLPKYRGAAPIQWAIANGEPETGVTIMQTDAGLDTGDMLGKARTPIGAEETAPELSARLAPMGAELLCEAIAQIEAATVHRERQNAGEATLAPILKKEDGLIHWHLMTASQIDHRLRVHSIRERTPAFAVSSFLLRAPGRLPQIQAWRLAGFAPKSAVCLRVAATGRCSSFSRCNRRARNA